MKSDFIHLHVHSEYSLLDGSAKIGDIVAKAKAMGMPAIALTDHGVMYGVIDFYKKAKAEGVKPILGCEVYVSSGSRFDKTSQSYYYHLILLAENNEGYKNLMKLVSLGFTEGFYYKPRVDIELLRKYSKGLIALSACVSGVVAKDFLSCGYEKARDSAALYKEIFGAENFFIEIQDHGFEDERKAAKSLIKIAEELGLGVAATNDSHYIAKEDAPAHDVLLCIQTGKTIDDPTRMRYETEELYIKSSLEMSRLFSYIPQALENTVKIAERCDVSIEFNNYKLPKYALPAGTDASLYLREQCERGILRNYGEITPEILSRLDYELDTIRTMGFVDYFLVVWDFINYAREKGIAVGPGRGSAAGSIVSYSLGITSIDPLKYNLLFERFLNIERISMPDIDIDFCYERRGEVINYVIEKYGAEYVAQIITFGTMAARAAIRDVGRSLGLAYSFVDRIAKLVPQQVGITLKTALENVSELYELYKSNDDANKLLTMAIKLEGLPRHASTHAAGVVICNEPVSEYVPLNLNDGVITTQFTMNTIEELGLLKMDFLGLRTLTVIQGAAQAVSLDISKISYEDASVYEMISCGDTDGVFQLERPGMRSFMKSLNPTCLEDIIAGISLYRPGPMDFIPKYVQGKNNFESVRYTHPSLAPILRETYGCIVYQEQVMQIVRTLAGYSLARSDLVRRAMSKKKTDVMAKERQNFIYGLGDELPGCLKNGIPKESAEKIFDEMTDFAKYAFNKSHAAAYAVVGYQTAYLKKHYPTEFMAALLTSVMDFTEKITEYIQTCKKMGIQIAAPNINESYAYFSVSNGKINYGLSAIKNVGTHFVQNLVEERTANGRYNSLTELVMRMSAAGHEVSKRVVEGLVFSGALDGLNPKIKYRKQYIEMLQGVSAAASSARRNNNEHQMSLFDDPQNNISKYDDPIPDAEEYSKSELLERERESLGIYLSGNPVDAYMEVMGQYIKQFSNDFAYNPSEETETPRVRDEQRVVIGGIINGIKTHITKKNQSMAFITLEDLYGAVEVVLFPNVYEKDAYRIAKGAPIMVVGKASVKEEENAKVLCDRIGFYDDILDNLKKRPVSG
ncbi:DNA-directed DNA polymerase [Clostridia bacterium]|nr:DNA-directed DNA polymerase [Clostridia bacterium]